MTNENPKQPDEPTEPTTTQDAELEAQIDALLSEAAATDLPTDHLEAKVLALTDPHMLSLLDEVLAPEQVNDALADRIIAATTPGAKTLATQPDEDRAVVGRIGFGTWRYAAAAAIALAAGIGVWQTTQQDTDPAVNPGPVAQNQQPDPSDTVVDTENNGTTEKDIETAHLESEETLFEDTTIEVQASIQDIAESADDITIDGEAIWSDFDDYTDFLSDVESNFDTSET